MGRVQSLPDLRNGAAVNRFRVMYDILRDAVKRNDAVALRCIRAECKARKI